MNRLKIMLPLLLLLGACRNGHDGRDGSNGTAGTVGPSGSSGPGGPSGPSGPSGPGGPTGPSGPSGLPGMGGSIPFSYEGTYNFPVITATQVIPGFSIEHGDVINVYIQWQGQPWTQIGSTWVGGMAGSYLVSGNTVTITTVIGPQFPLVAWVMNGIKSQ
jgi:hypothetical protein